MKARVKSTGEIIEVRESHSYDGEIGFLSNDSKFYYPDELDFTLFEPEEEVTIEAYVARDAVDGELNIFTDKPELYSNVEYWIADNGVLRVPKECEDMFENLDCKTIQEVTITIKPKKK